MEKIQKLIQEHKRNEAVLYVLDLLSTNKISITELYDVLRTTLISIDCKEGDKECIWKEHIKTAIVRTIIENTYPYVIQEVKKIEPKNKKVLVVCPPEEYHEIGAKMAHDYFLLSGYNSIYIGANTPVEVIMDAIHFENPDYIAISVTNYYNIVPTKRLINKIRENQKGLTILVGGQAFNETSIQNVNADKHITDFDSIRNL